MGVGLNSFNYLGVIPSPDVSAHSSAQLLGTHLHLTHSGIFFVVVVVALCSRVINTSVTPNITRLCHFSGSASTNADNICFPAGKNKQRATVYAELEQPRGANGNTAALLPPSDDL